MASSTTKNAVVLQAAEEGRQQGYREGYIDFAHKNGINIGISEEEYLMFDEARRIFDEAPSFQSLNRLIETTKKLLQ